MLDNKNKPLKTALMFKAYKRVYGKDFLIDSGSTSYVAKTYEKVRDLTFEKMIEYFSSSTFVRKQV